MSEGRSDPGWSLEDERKLGDSLQRVIRQRVTHPEDEAAREIARNAERWPGYTPGDEE